MGLRQSATRGLVSATMQLHVPEYIRTLVPYLPGKPIEETQREFGLKRVVKLASNENPLGPSPKAMAAIKKAAAELHRYPDSGAYRLKQAITASLNSGAGGRSASQAITPQQIIIGNGSNEIIDFLIRTFCVAGDQMVTSQAAFIAYKLCAQIHGVETVETPLTADLCFDLKSMVKTVRDQSRVRLVFIANPNNPTGTYVGAAELRAFLREVSGVRDGSVLVALDYAYWEYVTARDLADPQELLAEFPNVVVLRTFSKVYGLAGIRIGYGVGSAEVIAAVQKVRQPFNMNSLGLVAAEAALSDRAFVERSRRVNTAGMKFWETQLKKWGVSYWKSQGNFILADVSGGAGRKGMDVYQACLSRGVIFRPVANYGLPHALRISVGTSEENRIAARVLGEVLSGVSHGALTRKRAVVAKRKARK